MEPDDTDRSLIAGIRTGDPVALDTLLRKYGDVMVRYAGTIVGSTDIAQDVVQDVFIKLWEVRETLALSGSVPGYLLRLTRNRALNIARHERSLQRMAMASGPTNPLVRCEILNAGPEVIDQEELAKVVAEAVNTLPPRIREVFLLRRQARMSTAAVAETLGISPASVQVQLSRALQRIGQAIARWTNGSIPQM